MYETNKHLIYKYKKMVNNELYYRAQESLVTSGFYPSVYKRRILDEDSYVIKFILVPTYRRHTCAFYSCYKKKVNNVNTHREDKGIRKRDFYVSHPYQWY